MRSFYDILEVSACASAEEVKRAYFDYLRRIHPDKSAGAAKSEDSIDYATFIWTTLKDTNKRREYDCWLREQQYRETKGTVAERIEIGSDDTDPIVEPCRCGDYYSIASEEIQKIVDVGIFECASCSLCLEVSKAQLDTA
ncbi:DnaJ domain protein [Cooperia oncophora]